MHGCWLLVAAVTAVRAIVLRNGVRRVEQNAGGTHFAGRNPYERVHDVNARLIAAQDAERSRIARELHDDIGQQLAVLATNLQLSGDAGEALARIGAIAASVRALSHRLHPATLQLAGLVESVLALQRELSTSGVAIEFTHHDLPRDLPAAVTLCVFRVIQEGVHNAIKHGRARRISIDVRCVDSNLTLRIVDDGSGFDIESAFANGLGLISVVERVEGLGGKVVVRSQPGVGTEIAAQVPVIDRDGEPLTISASTTTCQNPRPVVSIDAHSMNGVLD